MNPSTSLWNRYAFAPPLDRYCVIRDNPNLLSKLTIPGESHSRLRIDGVLFLISGDAYHPKILNWDGKTQKILWHGNCPFCQKEALVMETPLAILITATVLAGLYIVAPFAHEVYRRFRYGKVVICPDTHQLAEVKLHSGWAALTAIFHKPVLRVKSCSSWPRRKGCAENCVRENWPTE